MKRKDEMQASWEALDDFCQYCEAQGKLNWHFRPVTIFPCRIEYFMKGYIRPVETNRKYVA
jgi:hypothetical protein